MDKIDQKILSAYVPFVGFMVLGDITNTIKGGTVNILAYLLLGTILLRYIVEKLELVPKEKLKYFGIAIGLFGTACGLIGALISTKVAGLMSSIQSFLFYRHGVFSSTVAEQAPGTWSNLSAQMGFGAGFDALQQFLSTITRLPWIVDPFFILVKTIGSILPVWILMFTGMIYIAYRSTHFETPQKRWIAIVGTLVSIISFKVLSEGSVSIGMQTMYILSIMITTAIVLRNNVPLGIILFLLFTAMLSYLPFIRLLIMVGLYGTFIAAYLLSDIIGRGYAHYKTASNKWMKELRSTYLVGVCILSTVFILGYISPGYSLGMQLGPTYNDNWDQAMTFMRENTTTSSAILSWWDFGYWFQLKAERATNLDGGNEFSDRNTPTAQYFVGMMNETQQKYFLEKMGSTHILVDASMIGKFSAMSKIANRGAKIDSYMFIPYRETRQTGTGNLLIYNQGAYTILVPFTNNNSIGVPRIVSGNSEVYIPRLCMPDRTIDLPVPRNGSVANVCLMLTQNQAILLTSEMAESPFHKLFFLDGEGLDYVEKVFDNGEVKIYEIDSEQIPRESKDDLQTWWETHSSEELTVDQ